MSDVRAGMIIAGKYRIEEPLAHGGMGSVWRARHVALDTPLAIKFISADVFALVEARRRFEREARAAALLRSPHVVQIHDYGMEGGFPYLVMELLSGEDLGERLKRKDRLSTDETVSIVIQVARALRRAAEAGVVHRDLKPSNVFLVRGDDDEELVKVLDFGIAKTSTLMTDDDCTKTGAIIGSPRYMSPEQARGSRLVDPRSDLWSLGVIAYRALTGQLPFQSMDMLELIEKICTETPTPPSQLEPSLDADVDAFFVRALCRDPAGRFQTAREMAAMFAIACGQPPPSITSSRLKLRSLLDVRPTLNGEPSRPVTPEGPPGPPVDEAARPSEPSAPAVTAAAAEASPAPASSPGAKSPPSGNTPPNCDPTRISGRPPPLSGRDSVTAPEPRRITPVPKGTPTPCPSDVDVPGDPSMPPPRRIRGRRVALGAGLAVLLVGVLALRAAWRGDAPPAVVESAATPLAETSHGVPLLDPPAPPPPPVPFSQPSATPEATAPPEATTPPFPRSAPLPGKGVRPRRKNKILGI